MSELISRQLKPCPFCGGTAIVDMDEYCYWDWHAWCFNCGCDIGHYATEEEAIEEWNKRAEPPADQWIPVTYRETTEEERECGIEWKYILDCPLPDNDTEILVCTKAGSVWTDTFFNDDGCYLDGGYDLTEIAAWQPLPKPYKGE